MAADGQWMTQSIPFMATVYNGTHLHLPDLDLGPRALRSLVAAPATRLARFLLLLGREIEAVVCIGGEMGDSVSGFFFVRSRSPPTASTPTAEQTTHLRYTCETGDPNPSSSKKQRAGMLVSGVSATTVRIPSSMNISSMRPTSCVPMRCLFKAGGGGHI